MRSRKNRVLAMVLVFVMAFTIGGVPSQAKPKTSGMKVKYHSQNDIRKYVKEHKFSTSEANAYAKKPSTKSSYKAGELKKSSLNNGLNALNTMRYVAGLPSNVKLDKNYNKKCQAAALISAINKELSHSPSKPEGMSKSLYDTAKSGANSSNLAMGYGNLASCILYGWVEDSDAANIDRVGHRRWVLNPDMKKTGFGAVDAYTAMYATNRSSKDNNYYGVAWPAQNMPIEYFSDSTAWSISMGEKVKESKVKVTLTRKKDKKKWTFNSKKANGYFNVDNSWYGQQGCIIFRPDDIHYNSGDVFQVKITGLKKTVSYEVKFFKL